MKINLGCGNDIRKGYINIDFIKFKGVDKVIDLNKFLYPFEDNSVDEVIMRNFLEHVNDSYKTMLEINRICKPKAKIYIKGPHFSSNNVWSDLQHKRAFSYQTFSNSNMNMFKILKRKITFSHWKFYMRLFTKLFPIFYETHLAFIFTAVDVEVILEKR